MVVCDQRVTKVNRKGYVRQDIHTIRQAVRTERTCMYALSSCDE
jgi:hypothetical protein